MAPAPSPAHLHARRRRAPDAKFVDRVEVGMVPTIDDDTRRRALTHLIAQGGSDCAAALGLDDLGGA